MEPSVSVPIVTAAMFAADAIAEPLLEEHGVADSTYGFCISNPKSIDVALQQWFLGLQEINFLCYVSIQDTEEKEGTATDPALAAAGAPAGGDAGAAEVKPLAEARGAEQHRAGAPEPLDHAGVARGA